MPLITLPYTTRFRPRRTLNVTINVLFDDDDLIVLPKTHFVYLGWFYFNHACSYTLKLTVPSSFSPPRLSKLHAAEVSRGLCASANTHRQSPPPRPRRETFCHCSTRAPKCIKSQQNLPWAIFIPCSALPPQCSAPTHSPSSPESLGQSGRVREGRAGRAAPLERGELGGGADGAIGLLKSRQLFNTCSSSRRCVTPLEAQFCLSGCLEAGRKTFVNFCVASAPPARGSLMVRPGARLRRPLPLPASSEALGATAPLSGVAAVTRPSASSALPRGGMDYLITITGKSGRLLRGTANRLWGFGGGGEARQVCFEDYLREPAPGDPGCGSPPPRPPALSNPEGPGEPSLPSLPTRRPRAEGWVAVRGGAGGWRGSRGVGEGAPGTAAAGGGGVSGSPRSARGGKLSAACVGTLPALPFLLASPRTGFLYAAKCFKGGVHSLFPPTGR